jgi:hypothetical protein
VCYWILKALDWIGINAWDSDLFMRTDILTNFMIGELWLSAIPMIEVKAIGKKKSEVFHDQA